MNEKCWVYKQDDPEFECLEPAQLELVVYDTLWDMTRITPVCKLHISMMLRGFIIGKKKRARYPEFHIEWIENGILAQDGQV